MTSFEEIKKRLIQIYSPSSRNNISLVCFQSVENFLKHLPVEDASDIRADAEGGIGLFYFFPDSSEYIWVNITNDGSGCVIASNDSEMVMDIDLTVQDPSVIASVVKGWIWG